MAIALQNNPSPSESDFAAAANKVVPHLPRQKITEPVVPKIQEPLVPQPAKVTVTSSTHPRHGESGTIQATKALNKQVKQALEKTIDLRLPLAVRLAQSLAVEPPKENATECLRLMGMALKNLATAMNNTQALEAAAIILGSEPTQSAIARSAVPKAIAYRAEQLEMLPQAVSDIRRALSQPRCTWQDYWAELSTQETELITALQNTSAEPDTIGVGSIVAHADPYRTLYVERGEVVEDLGEEVVVAWDHWRNESKKTDRYFRDELRFWQGENK